jgi:hypothetical protein
MDHLALEDLLESLALEAHREQLELQVQRALKG